MKKERASLALPSLLLNEGQLDWLPKNPRTWTQSDIDRTADSIKEDPDFLEDRPLLVVPEEGSPLFIVFAGNLRHEGAAAAKLGKVPCVVYYPETEQDRLTIVRRAMKDNGSFGSWDWDELGNNWDGLPLQDWGVPVWESEAQREMRNGGLSTEGKESGEGYDEFLDKFKQKLTTDDCYTPPEVYDAVKEFVDQKVRPLKGVPVIRPFYPGGNYEDLSQYPKGCVVLDNPPFSLLSKILRFYSENRIECFLFGPQLTLFSAHEVEDLCYLPVNVPVTYENGAVVSTGFITNMVPDLKIWIPAGLRHKLREVQRDDSPIDEYLIPSCVITSARLGVVAGVAGCELKISRKECQYIKNLESMEEKGKGLYGGGYLISYERATYIEKEKEKEKEKRLHSFPLSDKEKAIVASLAKSAEIET